MLENLLHSKHSELWKSLASAAPGYAKLSGFVTRASATFSPVAFLLTLISASTNGKTTLTELAQSLCGKNFGAALSPQAIHARMNRTELGLEKFLIRCLVHVCLSRWNLTPRSAGSPFTRIIIEDSTFVPFHKSNSENFPAHGNAKGKTAGCKIDLAFDLMSGEILSNELHAGTQQDKTIGEDLLALIRPNDLILRDMGYFGVSWFARIGVLGAFWLSRVPLNVNVVGENGKTIEKILGSCHGGQLDIQVFLTDARHPARLIAVRASREETEKRRREIRATAKAKGRTPSARSLLRAGWHILVTNIPKEMQDVEALVAIYSQRWQIEIVFRGWKQASKLGPALGRKSSPQHLKGIALASMILLSVGVKISIGLIRKQGGRYSLEKIYAYLAENLATARELPEISRIPPHTRYLETQKRRRKSLATRYLEVLV